MSPNELAMLFGKNVRVTARRVVNIVKSAVYDTQRQGISKRFDYIKLLIFSQLQLELNEFARNLLNIIQNDMGLVIATDDMDFLMSYANAIPSITTGQIFWRLFNEAIVLKADGEIKPNTTEVIDFFEQKVYNVLMDGLYKLTRMFVASKLMEQKPDVVVGWYSMNGGFKHPMCKKRQDLTAVMKDVPRVFKELCEKNYNWLHPHFLCDGIFLPKG